MLPTNVGAAVGIEQLKKINELQGHRKKIWDYYQKSFEGVNFITKPIDPEEHETHSYFTYVITVDVDRDTLAKFLLDNGIYTTLRYHPLHMNQLYNSEKFLPNSNILNEKSLSIPIHPNLPFKDAEYVVKKIKEFVESYKK